MNDNSEIIKVKGVDNETGEKKMESNENQNKSSFLNKIKFWQISSVVLLILFIVSLMANFSGSGISGAISKDEAKGRIQQYANIVTGGAVVDVGNAVEDKNTGLYKVPLTIKGQAVDSYVTKDGKLFFPAVVNLNDFFQQVKNLGNSATGQAVKQPTTQQPSQRINVSAEDDPVLGNKNAPVTIVEFSDFQCPFCGQFEKYTYPQLKQEYINTGKVKLVYRDFPLSNIHPYAEKAAEASECAHDQNNYWEYHDKLFANQNALTVDDLKNYAKDLKLDTDKFNKCLDSGAKKDEVQKDMNDGESYRVSGTPDFFIDGIELSGAQPFENFKNIIDQELNKVNTQNKEEVNNSGAK